MVTDTSELNAYTMFYMFTIHLSFLGQKILQSVHNYKSSRYNEIFIIEIQWFAKAHIFLSEMSLCVLKI